MHTQRCACQCLQSCDYFSILNRWANTGFRAKVRGDTRKIELNEASGRRRRGGGEKGGAKMRRQNEYNERINRGCSLEEFKDKIKYKIS